MYNAIFESNNGQKYVFGANGSTVFDMNIGDGINVDISTSQGFSQVGESVETQSVSGKYIDVNGVIYGNIQSQKNRMRNVFAPFASGKLVFENKYFIRVWVKDTPTFSALKDDGRFSMRLYAPFPFFLDVSEKISEIGSVEPMFMFPINYAESHVFGIKSASRYINIVNPGDVKVPLNLHIDVNGISTNPVIANLGTFETLKLNGVLNSGDSVDIYRTPENVLVAELNSNGAITDIISWIDEHSDLFELNVGDNLISATDEENGANLVVKIRFNPALVAVYET